MKQHRKINDPTPVKAEIFSSCIRISSYTVWRQTMKKLKEQLKGRGFVHVGYMYKNRKAWDSGTGCCYIPEHSDREYTRNDIEDICQKECDRKKVKYISAYAGKVFSAITWDTPEEIAKDIIRRV